MRATKTRRLARILKGCSNREAAAGIFSGPPAAWQANHGKAKRTRPDAYEFGANRRQKTIWRKGARKCLRDVPGKTFKAQKTSAYTTTDSCEKRKMVPVENEKRIRKCLQDVPGKTSKARKTSAYTTTDSSEKQKNVSERRYVIYPNLGVRGTHNFNLPFAILSSLFEAVFEPYSLHAVLCVVWHSGLVASWPFFVDNFQRDLRW